MSRSLASDSVLLAMPLRGQYRVLNPNMSAISLATLTTFLQTTGLLRNEVTNLIYIDMLGTGSSKRPKAILR
jgi:hypothetical protein